ncbi:DUF3313 family protein [Neiella sp. HB171785]|uniref:DUF3313 family protein n=1 Tax=Neiella litorisoli TaxID=2771431 RepID=A0A8J6R2L5_9GAMM|nr:DUF3313 family protein [Neiella litorisoli]MBD1388990.1 DUF3313 family protein [Neiella litorisoli]
MKSLSVLAVCISLACASFASVASDENRSEVQHSQTTQLTAVESPRVDQLLVNEAADFARYDNLMLAQVQVSFREKAYRSSFSTRNQMNRAIANVTPKIQQLFAETFSAVTKQQGHFQMVSQHTDNTLVVVPRLVDVYLANLDDMSHSGRTSVYAQSAGHMTLVVDLYDASTGEMLARAVDHQQATEWSRAVRQSSVDNTQQIRRMVTSWTTDLNQGLKQLNQPM